MPAQTTSGVHAPRIGQDFANRSAIKAVWGGDYQGGMATFPAEGGSVVNIFSDEGGPYPDRRVPGTELIQYVGQGTVGDQSLSSRGNALMERARTAGAACRYWHRPVGGPFVFERWVAIVGRHREWQRGDDSAWRRAFVYTLAPVGSPDPSDWPADVLEVAQSRDVQDQMPESPPDAAATAAPPKRILYADLADRAAASDGRDAGTRTSRAFARSAAARQAVLLRAEGLCENPVCAGMPCDRRPDGTAILDVDHVRDLALGGPDVPSNMVALCPNCHAAKTRGGSRRKLMAALRRVAKEADQRARSR